MSLNLKSARTAVKNRVAGISGIELVEEDQLPEGVTPPRDQWNQMSPYAVIHFGRPVPDYGRTLADGEADYPHVWPTWVELVAPSGYSINDLADDLDASLLDWQPDGDNSTGLSGSASYSYSIASVDNMPARKVLNRYYICKVNLSRS